MSKKYRKKITCADWWIVRYHRVLSRAGIYSVFDLRFMLRFYCSAQLNIVYSNGNKYSLPRYEFAYIKILSLFNALMIFARDYLVKCTTTAPRNAISGGATRPKMMEDILLDMQTGQLALQLKMWNLYVIKTVVIAYEEDCSR